MSDRLKASMLIVLFHSEIEQIWQLSWRGGFYRGGPVFMSALAGIDIALWDLKGTYISLLFHSAPSSITLL